MDRVAEESELAKGTLYLYFKNKEEILAEISLKSRNLLFLEFERVVKTHPEPIQQMRAIIEANYNFHRLHPLYYDLVSLYEVNNQFTETPELQVSSYKITQLVVGIADKAKQDGTLSDWVDPHLFSMVLWGSTVGMIQFMKIRGPLIEEYQGISKREILDSFLDILEKGYKK